MAQQADGVDVAEIQKLGIIAAVRFVAGRAACLLDGSVFVHPWTGEIGVAFQTSGGLLRDGRLQARFKSAVRIVTCGALDWAVVDFVLNGGRELGLYPAVTLVAEGGLRGLQRLPFLACVDGMTACATDVGCGVS